MNRSPSKIRNFSYQPPSFTLGLIKRSSPDLDSGFCPTIDPRNMLDFINDDRRAAGLSAVDWDSEVASAAHGHAQEMAVCGFFSHWNRQGMGPDLRYGLAGGVEGCMENLSMFAWKPPQGLPAPDLGIHIRDVLRKSEESLMKSPGHRAAILFPSQTHVGVGIALNPRTGSFYLAQEFLARHIRLERIPPTISVGNSLEIRGELLGAAISPVINLSWEPIPCSISSEDLDTKMPKSYRSTAKYFQAYNPVLRGNTFNSRVTMDYEKREGFYHILIFVDAGGRSTLAVDAVVEVR